MGIYCSTTLKLKFPKKIEWVDASAEMSEWVKIARTHFTYKGFNVSVANGFGTYGGWSGANIGADEEKDNLGLLEVYIPLVGDPGGWLKAEEAMKFIEERLGALNENATD